MNGEKETILNAKCLGASLLHKYDLNIHFTSLIAFYFLNIARAQGLSN